MVDAGTCRRVLLSIETMSCSGMPQSANSS